MTTLNQMSSEHMGSSALLPRVLREQNFPPCKDCVCGHVCACVCTCVWCGVHVCASACVKLGLLWSIYTGPGQLQHLDQCDYGVA